MSWESLRAFASGAGRADLGPAPDDVDLEAALDRNLAEALLAHDPGARLARRLSARVSGPTVRPGRLDAHVSEQLLGAVRREVAGASPGDDPAVTTLELVGVGTGSAVLYLEPAVDGPGPDPGELVEAPDPLDDAVRTVLDLHRAAEGQEALERFAGRTPLLKAFDSLTSSLDEHDLDIELGWRSRTGSHQRASLTRVGRDHARRYLVRSEQADVVELTGRVTVLDLGGSFTVRAGPARNAARSDVALPDGLLLTDLGLELGETVTVRVRRTVARARVGLESKAQFLFVDFAGSRGTAAR